MQESDFDRSHRLVFDGVYRDAMVYINDDVASQARSRYTGLSLTLTRSSASVRTPFVSRPE
ncbi:hypothetical protein [Pseudarthrobacter sp. lyk4-40-TYG-27]|uniref:hypothetical protein n=1 Tax=Pseudarthrobacter sp. lyk4-40-TYG-27 TaxID=3040305 RepID=UPI0025560E7E|nr:hypothetical protein [Pseudarthrobacter sp. lyk4-40-TYG-27]